MNSIDEAKHRLDHLFRVAEQSEDSSLKKGKLSRADFDEIRFLVKLLGNTLPPLIRELVGASFPDNGGRQKNFGERARRALELVAKFGEPSGDQAQLEQDALLPRFELEASDQERVLKLCTDMRKIVFSSSVFDDPHKKRLLNRIAAIEKQVHSKKGLFDVILGGVSDVGETLGKFGTDIKPLTDRMNEVAQIVRKGTTEYDQIPGPEEVKKLPAPASEDA